MTKFNSETILGAYESGIARKVIDRLANSLSDCVGVYGCDLHSRLFNDEPLYVWHGDAIDDLNELGVFNCIRLVREYEQSNFGEFYTAIEPSKIANMVCYIVGEFINESSHLTNHCWNERLTEKDLETIADELQVYLESLAEDLSNVAFDEWEI